MRSRSIIIIAPLFVLVGFMAYFSTVKRTPQADLQDVVSGEPAEIPHPSGPLQRIQEGEYALEVASRQEGTLVLIERVVFAEPGFVVLRDDLFGEPGVIVGMSGLLPAGETKGVVIESLQASPGESTFFAMLYVDDGNGRFKQLEDSQLVDADEKPIMAMFTMQNAGGVQPDVSY
ncbi:MAG: hypothetical protein AAB490_01470 [Patescibacteria group bacterium]